MLTVKESEALRTQYSEVSKRLQALKAEKPTTPAGKKLFKNDIAELQAQYNAMWEQIKDAPAAVVAPDQAWERIVEIFAGVKNSAAKMCARFEDEAKTNLIYSTQWYIADALMSEAQVKAIRWFDNLADGELDTIGKLARFAEMYPEFIRNLEETILRSARGMASRSTSTASNFAEDMTGQGVAQLLYEFTESSPRWQINRALDGFNSWKELQNDK